MVYFYGTSTIVGHLMPNLFLYIEAVLFQTIQFSMNIDFVHAQLNVKTVLFQTTQFSISTQFKYQKQLYFKTIHFSISIVFCLHTVKCQNCLVLFDPEWTCITGTSPSDCLVSYQDTCWGSFTPPQRCSWCILQPQPTGPLNLLSISYQVFIAYSSVWVCYHTLIKTVHNISVHQLPLYYQLQCIPATA